MRSLFLLAFGVISALCLPGVALAGAFAGAEVDGNSQTTWYAGAQSEAPLYYAAFVGQQQYQIDERTQTHMYMAGGVGYRWYGSWTSSALLGLEHSRLNAMQRGASRQTFQGLYAQLAMMKFAGDHNLEYLASYSQDSEQFWTRLRLKFYSFGGHLIGPELFASKLLSNEIRGAGLLVEKLMFPYTFTAKLGVKDESGSVSAYAGLEFYRPF